ncbi:C6 finger domain-containing protein [Trichophyton equinum CBS 127.97]|uniref:C6 finger domain-containing protein n=1 Tax=Trichophyton equinum (strain ATCC MYA-4606 / CBS 127.97) TaxID=559882 RepID=F2Q032_TRIEC|nr:C6 finger domain-containing protein [Trichophyton equinum CBS 127.97]
MDISSSDAARPSDLKQDAATVRGQPSCPPSAQSCDPPAPSSPAQDKPKQSKSRNETQCDETNLRAFNARRETSPAADTRKATNGSPSRSLATRENQNPKTQKSDPEERESQCVRQYKCRFINVTAEDMPRAPPAVEAPPSASGSGSSGASFDSRVTPLLEGLDIQGNASGPETAAGIQLQQGLVVAREAVPFSQYSGDFTPTFTSETQHFTSDSHSPLADSEDDNVQEVVRQGIPGELITLKRKRRPASPSRMHTIPVPSPINFAADSAEMLLLRFDRRTCGILSVKDGAAENPWRTAITPLIPDTPALYHAVCALAAFHSTKENAAFKYLGMEHMRQSVRTLAVDIESMNIDAALATTLALAFADTWDTHVSTGVHHLRGAKVLFDRAVARYTHMPLSPSDQSRLMFLYNGWMYIAVIAQLTSREDTGFDQIPFPPIFTPQVHEVDPLLGCAASLFPLIGRVAVLVQNVRKVPVNSVAIVSQAMELKTLIEQWAPPRYFKPPEDPTSNIQDSFQTAQAYRWAILLHLHLAVPEIPSESTSELANRILITLATIPLGSRTLVVQIFPLLVASCEADSEEDRNWARIRWAEMQQRMAIGNVDRCVEVVCEVWKRRDARKAALMNRQSDIYSLPLDTPVSGACSRHDSVIEPLVFAGRQDSRVFTADDINAAASTTLPETFTQTPSSSPTVSLASSRGDGSSDLCRIFPEYERTVRGNLHWLSVMGDWGWEGSYFMSYNGGYLNSYLVEPSLL